MPEGGGVGGIGEAALEALGAFLGEQGGLICGAYFTPMHEFLPGPTREIRLDLQSCSSFAWQPSSITVREQSKDKDSYVECMS